MWLTDRRRSGGKKSARKVRVSAPRTGEKRKLVARMKSERPSVPIISVRTSGDSYEPLVDGFLQSMDGPTKLLSCVAGALSGSSPKQASA